MKTGGTTLTTGLRKQLPPDQIYPHQQLDIDPASSTGAAPFRHLTMPYLRGLPEERRRQIRVYVGHLPFVACEVIGGDLDTVTLLRDPVDRTISLLRQLRRSTLRGDATPNPMAGLRLEEVNERPSVYVPLILNHQTKIFSMTMADDPKGYMQPIDIDHTRLALAKQNIGTVHVLGLTDHYDEFRERVTERFGWAIKRDAHANAAPAAAPAEVSASLRRRIAADNAIDMELYDHAVELHEAHRRR